MPEGSRSFTVRQLVPFVVPWDKVPVVFHNNIA